jgi:hypothetical protein
VSSIITRRSLLRGLFAMPAIVAADRLMPIRGLILPDVELVMPDVQTIRNLLLPGLYGIHSSELIPMRWSEIFKENS